jgi:hypothetical protein
MYLLYIFIMFFFIHSTYLFLCLYAYSFDSLSYLLFVLVYENLSGPYVNVNLIIRNDILLFTCRFQFVDNDLVCNCFKMSQFQL